MYQISTNADLELSRSLGHERQSGSTDLPHSKRNHPSDKGTLKFLLAALGLLLCALVALCVLGVLYHNKSIAYEALSEQYSSAAERLSVQERSATELKFCLDPVLMDFENTSQHQESKGKQVKSAASSDGTAVPQPSTVDQPSNRDECTSTPTTLTEPNLAEASHGNCSKECKKCGVCGEGWRSFGVKCYYFSTDKLNWTMSRDHCAQKGGHLVIITSRDEQNFITSRVYYTHWIGLSDLETEGRWMWVNNQTLAETGVTFWLKRTGEAHEPDNWTGEDPSGEDCAALGNETGATHVWFDAPCFRKKRYICEKQKN